MNYIISQDIMDILFRQLGDYPEQLKIMIVLIGSNENTTIEEQWLLQRIGLDSISCKTALKLLEEKEYITITKNNIIVNFKNLI